MKARKPGHRLSGPLQKDPSRGYFRVWGFGSKALHGVYKALVRLGFGVQGLGGRGCGLRLRF